MTDVEEDAAWIDEVQDLMEAGEWQPALDLLETAPEEDGVRWLLSSAVWLEVGQVALAADDLEKARAILGEDDADVVRAEARVAILEWRFEDARAALEKLALDDWGADLLFDRSLIADVFGEHDKAIDLLEKAHSMDPEALAKPLRLSTEEFKSVVSDAADELPDEFKAVFDKVPVVIDAMPTAEVLAAPESGHPPDTLGVYLGPPLHEYSGDPGSELPPSIFLFQRNLERIGVDLDHLREEIRITLYHELAHALGFEEDGVERMGLE